jgi:S1-C subfamily serine protease
MHFRILATIAIAFCLAHLTAGQVPPPKHESAFHHIFAAHRDVDNLQQRVEALTCALVLIEAGPRVGTGFYISADGDVATASHVLGDRSFAVNADQTIQVNIATPTTIWVTNSKGERKEFPIALLEQNADAWMADIARIKTGATPSCWLQQADDLRSHPGEHLITMGFPGLSFQTLTLYEGIMSARLKTNLPIGMAKIGDATVAVVPTNEYLRVQMPISTGLSGAPIIDDENRVIAVVTNAGFWTPDLDHLLMAFRGGAFNPPSPATPQPPSPPNTVTFTLNGLGVTAELAQLVHDYASPGYGDAVPLRYLKKPVPQSPPSAPHSH